MKLIEQFDRDGFVIVPELISAAACDALVTELSAEFERQQAASRRTLGGLRNILQASSRAAAISKSEEVSALVSGLMGRAAFPVRAILFDKTGSANWGVPWHQDLAIAVAERIDTAGFRAWSVKQGVVQVQPPHPILQGMLTVRLHLDDCRVDNGPLRVIPGTHLLGELDAEAIEDCVQQRAAVSCEVSKGGALLMRPLLLHASSRARHPSHRRVLHVEYASAPLPHGLRWSESA